MQVLLTGASGFLGSHLIPGLSRAGFDGVAVSRVGINRALPARWSEQRRDTVLRGTLDGQVDTVIHLEVKQHVFQPTVNDLQAFTTVNVEGTQTWLDWCAGHGVHRFLYFSSIKAVRSREQGARSREQDAGLSAVGLAKAEGRTSEDGERERSRERERVDNAESAIVDESASGPNETPYGASKWQAEERVQAWVRQDGRRSALILRPAVIYGPGNTANVAAMVQALRKGRFFLVGKNDNRKSLVSVRNVVGATVHLLPRMQPGQCDVYNLTDAETLSVRELDARIRRIMGKSGNSPTLPVPLARMAAKIGDVVNRAGIGFPLTTQRLDALLETTHFSCAKLLSTGFVHPQTVDEGLAEMIAATK